MSSKTPPGSDSEGAETSNSTSSGALDPLTALLREVEGTSATTTGADSPDSGIALSPNQSKGKRRK